MKFIIRHDNILWYCAICRSKSAALTRQGVVPSRCALSVWPVFPTPVSTVRRVCGLPAGCSDQFGECGALLAAQQVDHLADLA